jgi:hypothetical protein
MLALAAVTMGLLASGVAAADNYFMGRSVYGYAGYSPGGSLYINALPSDAEVRLDGVPIGQANDLQASLVETHAGVHTLTFQAPGYEAGQRAGAGGTRLDDAGASHPHPISVARAAEKGPSASLAPSATRSTYGKYASRVAFGRRLAAGPF